MPRFSEPQPGCDESGFDQRRPAEHDFGISRLSQDLDTVIIDPATIRRRGSARARRRELWGTGVATAVAAVGAIALIAVTGPWGGTTPIPAQPYTTSTLSGSASASVTTPTPTMATPTPSLPPASALLPDPLPEGLPTSREFHHSEPGDLVRLTASNSAFEPVDNVCIEVWSSGSLEFTMSATASYARAGTRRPTDYVSVLGFPDVATAQKAFASVSRAYAQCADSYAPGAQARGAVHFDQSGTQRGARVRGLAVGLGPEARDGAVAEILLVQRQNRLLWVISYRDAAPSCEVGTDQGQVCGLLDQVPALLPVMLR